MKKIFVYCLNSVLRAIIICVCIISVTKCVAEIEPKTVTHVYKGTCQDAGVIK